MANRENLTPQLLSSSLSKEMFFKMERAEKILAKANKMSAREERV